MKDEVKTKLLLAALALLIMMMLFSTIFMIGLCRELKHAKDFPNDVVTKTDTVYITDTIRIVAPKETEEMQIGCMVATLEKAAQEVSDSSRHEDVIVPIVQKIYSDAQYKAYVSGYLPTLDSIFFFPQTERITITNTIPVKIKPKPRRWGLGVQAGCTSYKGKPQPYIGLGISYNIITW